MVSLPYLTLAIYEATPFSSELRTRRTLHDPKHGGNRKEKLNVTWLNTGGVRTTGQSNSVYAIMAEDREFVNPMPNSVVIKVGRDL